MKTENFNLKLRDELYARADLIKEISELFDVPYEYDEYIVFNKGQDILNDEDEYEFYRATMQNEYDAYKNAIYFKNELISKIINYLGKVGVI